MYDRARERGAEPGVLLEGLYQDETNLEGRDELAETMWQRRRDRIQCRREGGVLVSVLLI